MILQRMCELDTQIARMKKEQRGKKGAKQNDSENFDA